MNNPNPPSKECRPSLQRLRQLCTQLNDRDVQIKKDIELFEEFFDNFPIPVTIWSVGSDHSLLSKRGDTFPVPGATTLEEIFRCPEMRKQSIEKHELALGGDTVSYFVEDSGCLYWTKLVPRLNKDQSIAGVVGISWDVTANSTMLSTLENIVDMTQDGTPLDDIRKEAIKGLTCSRLKKMLEQEKP